MAPSPLGNFRCPGIFREIEVVICPDCSGEVEFFAGDRDLKCANCGISVRRRSASCLDRCPARQSSCYRALKAEREEGGGGVSS